MRVLVRKPSSPDLPVELPDEHRQVAVDNAFGVPDFVELPVVGPHPHPFRLRNVVADPAVRPEPPAARHRHRHRGLRCQPQRIDAQLMLGPSPPALQRVPRTPWKATLQGRGCASACGQGCAEAGGLRKGKARRRYANGADDAGCAEMRVGSRCHAAEGGLERRPRQGSGADPPLGRCLSKGLRKESTSAAGRSLKRVDLYHHLRCRFRNIRQKCSTTRSHLGRP